MSTETHRLSGAAARAVAGPPRERRRRRSPMRQSLLWPLLFVGPTAVGLGLFYVWPTIRTIFISMTETGPFGGSTWVGFENYTKLFQNPDLPQALLNTGLYALLSLVGIPIAMAIAGLLNTRGLRGRGFYRTIYFLPVVTMPAAIAIVWRIIYNGDYGILNSILGVFGIQGMSWLTNPDTVMFAVALVGIWSGLGSTIVIFLAGLQGVPADLLEAAELDGAGPVRRFISVTVPMISPSVFFVSVMSLIGSLQVFDLVYVMVGADNPAMPRAKTIVYLFYEAGFLSHEQGAAGAIACVLLVIILLVTVVQFALQKKWVHYE